MLIDALGRSTGLLSLDEQEGGDSREEQDGDDQSALRAGQIPAPILSGAPATLLLEILLPFLHQKFVEKQFREGNISGVNGGLGAAIDAEVGRRHRRPRGKILGQFGMPGAGRLGHRPLGCHPLFYRATPVVALIRFHGSPSPVENLWTIAPNS